MKKTAELKSLREKNTKALLTELAQERNNLAKAQIKLTQEKKPAPHKIDNIKKKIARIKTIIYEKLVQELAEKENEK